MTKSHSVNANSKAPIIVARTGHFRFELITLVLYQLLVVSEDLYVTQFKTQKYLKSHGYARFLTLAIAVHIF